MEEGGTEGRGGLMGGREEGGSLFRGNGTASRDEERARDLSEGRECEALHHHWSL